MLGVSAVASAENIQLNQSVPAVSVTDKGELVMNNDGNWIINRGKANSSLERCTIQHIAGRSSAKELNAPLVEAIKQAVPSR